MQSYVHEFECDGVQVVATTPDPVADGCLSPPQCHKFDGAFIAWSIFAIIVARAVHVIPLSFIVNMVRWSPPRFRTLCMQCPIACASAPWFLLIPMYEDRQLYAGFALLSVCNLPLPGRICLCSAHQCHSCYAVAPVCDFPACDVAFPNHGAPPCS